MSAYIFFAPLILLSFVLPDIDHDDSIPKFTIMALVVAMIVYSILNLSHTITICLFVFLALMWLLPWIPGWQHRGHCHSFIFIAILTTLVIWMTMDWKIGVLFALGALSHLIADDELKTW